MTSTQTLLTKQFNAQKKIEDYLQDPNHKTKFLAILDKMGTIDQGVTYNFCMDNEKITGFVWMTSVMGSILYQFGSFINVDFMKRKTNIHLWPYIGPVVMNDLKKKCVIYKSIMLEERNTKYYFVLKSIFLMAPNYKKHNFKVIYADGFFL